MASIEQIEGVLERQEEGAVIEIMQPSGDPYVGLDGATATITVVGSESKQYRASEMAESRKLLKGGRAKLTPEQLRSQRINKAASAVVEWSGWDDGKKDLPCTLEHVKDVIRHEHILRQVEAGIDDHAGFSGRSSTT